MAIIGGRNMYEACDIYSVINSNIFKNTFCFCPLNELPLHSYELFETGNYLMKMQQLEVLCIKECTEPISKEYYPISSNILAFVRVYW